MPDEVISPGEEVVATPPPIAEKPKEPEESRTNQTTISEYLESLLVTVILALFGTSFVVQAFKIPSPSMEKTLLVGDHLLVNKFIFGGRGHWYDKLLPYRELQRGDIIVFKFPLSGPSAFREAGDRFARRPPEGCRSAGVHQRQTAQGTVRGA